MTDVSYTVSSYSTAGSGKLCGGKHKHAHEADSSTTGASGSAFELLLNGQANGDDTTTDPLTCSDTDSSSTGTSSDLGSAYQSLFAKLQANGGMDDTSAAQLNDAFSQLQAGGPVNFSGISANQNPSVDSPVNELNSKLNLDANV
jgi:hypothetical protein